MHCTRKITDALIWVGVDSRRQALFEAVYSIPEGVSYNSYLLRDEKNVLFDTVDRKILRLSGGFLHHRGRCPMRKMPAMRLAAFAARAHRTDRSFLFSFINSGRTMHSARKMPNSISI